MPGIWLPWMTRLVRALALVAALMLVPDRHALANVVATPSGNSTIGVSCVVGAVGAGVLALFGGIFALPTGGASVELAKPLMLTMLGGCVVGVASETTRQVLTE